MSHAKVMCSLCGTRPARFSRHGIVKSDADHNICLQCFRSLAEHKKQLQEAPPIEVFELLTEGQQIAILRCMLENSDAQVKIAIREIDRLRTRVLKLETKRTWIGQLRLWLQAKNPLKPKAEQTKLFA